MTKMTGTQNEPRVRREDTWKHLRCDFTEEEKKEIADQVMRQYAHVDALKDEKKAVVSEYAAKVNSADAQVRSLVGQHRSGYEMRSVECERVYRFDEKAVYVFRKDTAELVEERTMTDRELQLEIDFEDTDDGLTPHVHVTEAAEYPVVDAEYTGEELKDDAVGEENSEAEPKEATGQM